MQTMPPDFEGLSGSETILVVEDDKGLRELVRKLLMNQGYRVLESENGEKAIELVRSFKDTIHLLISDVVMPKISGSSLARILHPLKPDMKTIFMSGYTDEAMLRHGKETGFSNFLQKPFSPEDLLTIVRNVLDRNDKDE